MSAPTHHQTVIESRSGWQLLNWRELVEYRDLFYFLVLRDIKVLYKQTVLGFSWAIIRPVFSMIVFSVVFGGLASVPSDGVPYPVFSYAALLPWTYFSTAMTKSTASLVGNVNMLTKVYFPRLVIPMTPVLAGLVDFGIASLVLAALMAWFGIAPTIYILLLPFLVLLMVLTASGIGMWLSALAIQYRDIKHAMTFLAQLLMYAAPVVWPVSLITEKFPEWGETIRLVYGLYPMAGVIEGFRAALLGTTAMPWDLLGMGTLSAVLLALSGAFYFRRMERVFADVA
ncbi:MAG: ABC transporter permease [Rhodothermales bacterium]